MASSKTDQHRQGHTTRIPAVGGPACPLAAWRSWRRWLTAADTTTEHARNQASGGTVGTGRLAPEFRPIRKGPPAPDDPARPGEVAPALAVAARRVGHRAITDRSIADIIKRRAAAAGLPGTFSGHSLRRGFATAAYTHGVDELAIMRHGRWRSQAVMRGYIAEADRHRADNPIIALGLDTTSDSSVDSRPARVWKFDGSTTV